MRITSIEFRSVFRKLAHAFRPPPAAQEDWDEFVKTWLKVLGDVSPAELNEAAMEYMRTEDNFFPNPGQLRALALRRRTQPRYEAPEEGACDVCGAEAGGEHDPEKHRNAFRGVWKAIGYERTEVT